MRICHFTELEGVVEGGIKTSIRHQRKAMDAAGVDYTTDPDDEFDILHLNLLGPRSVYLMWRAMEDGRSVVLHTHTTGEDFRNSVRFSNLASPVVDRYTAAIYSRADRLIAPSSYTRDLIVDKGIDTPVDVVSNGVDTERLDGFEELRSERNSFHVINLGLVFERKGLSDFVGCGRRMTDTEFTWYGPELNRLIRSRAVKKSMSEAPPNVEFPGFIEDVRSAFASADVFFFPTHEENQGISLLEAAYCELPLVIRDIPVYEDVFIHGENCLKADSVDGFVEALQRLREDDTLREELGENAGAMAEQHSLDRVGEALEEVYRKVYR